MGWLELELGSRRGRPNTRPQGWLISGQNGWVTAGRVGKVGCLLSGLSGLVAVEEGMAKEKEARARRAWTDRRSSGRNNLREIRIPENGDLRLWSLAAAVGGEPTQARVEDSPGMESCLARAAVRWQSLTREKKKNRDELGRAEARLGPPLSAIISARRWRIPVPQPRPGQI